MSTILRRGRDALFFFSGNLNNLIRQAPFLEQDRGIDGDNQRRTPSDAFVKLASIRPRAVENAVQI